MGGVASPYGSREEQYNKGKGRGGSKVVSFVAPHKKASLWQE